MKIIFLLLAFIFIFTAVSVYSNVENFMSLSDILGKKDGSVDRFKYFEMVPEDNKWSEKTKKEFLKKFIEKHSNHNIKDNEELLNFYQRVVSEEEVQEYIKTGRWPLNDYIKDNLKLSIKNDESIKEEDREEKYNELLQSPLIDKPNSFLLSSPALGSLVHNFKKPEDMVGQVKFLYSDIKLDNGVIFRCEDKYNFGIMYPTTNGNEVSNYSNLEKTIPEFKFLKKPCNPCDTKCPFSYEGVLAAPFARYWGISSETGKSTPSTFSKPTSSTFSIPTFG